MLLESFWPRHTLFFPSSPKCRLGFGVVRALAWLSRMSEESKYSDLGDIMSPVSCHSCLALILLYRLPEPQTLLACQVPRPCGISTPWLTSRWLWGYLTHSSLSSSFLIQGLPALEWFYSGFSRKFMWCCFFQTWMTIMHMIYHLLHIWHIYTNCIHQRARF